VFHGSSNHDGYSSRFLLSTGTFQLVCGVAIASERLRNCLSGDVSEIAYMVADGSLKLRQDDMHLVLGVGSNGLLTQFTNAVF
jgi:hypothetical protein